MLNQMFDPTEVALKPQPLPSDVYSVLVVQNASRQSEENVWSYTIYHNDSLSEADCVSTIRRQMDLLESVLEESTVHEFTREDKTPQEH